MTHLMQHAHQAYEAKDLLKLLDLQARLDSHAAGSAELRAMGLSAATLRHCNQLLGQELDDLRAALLIKQDRLLESHPQLGPYLMGRTDGKTRAEVLTKAGQYELRLLQLQIEEAPLSLKALSDGTCGRRWLTAQRQRQREARQEQESRGRLPCRRRPNPGRSASRVQGRPGLQGGEEAARSPGATDAGR